MRARTLLPVAVLLAACGGGGTPTATTQPDGIPPPTTTATTSTTVASDPGTQLASARATWASSQPGSYSFRLVNDCGECNFDPDGEQVVVWDGAEPVATGPQSVDELFDYIESEIEAGRDVDVVYDGDTGHPVDIWVDQEARSYDGGTHLVVESFTSGLPGAEVEAAALEEAAALWDANGPDAYRYDLEVFCGCPAEFRATIRVAPGTPPTFERYEPSDPTISATPIGLDRLFEDLSDLFAGEDEFVLAGSALYDATDGHPIWIGLELDPTAQPIVELGSPSRLVFAITSLGPLDD